MVLSKIQGEKQEKFFCKSARQPSLVWKTSVNISAFHRRLLSSKAISFCFSKFVYFLIAFYISRQLIKLLTTKVSWQCSKISVSLFLFHTHACTCPPPPLMFRWQVKVEIELNHYCTFVCTGSFWHQVHWYMKNANKVAPTLDCICLSLPPNQQENLTGGHGGGGQGVVWEDCIHTIHTYNL